MYVQACVYTRVHTEHKILMCWPSVGSLLRGIRAPSCSTLSIMTGSFHTGFFCPFIISPGAEACAVECLVLVRVRGVKNPHVLNMLVAMCFCERKPGQGCVR